MYHYINGYTSKVAGTEVGITDPVRTFSAAFGEAFIVLHPNDYANMLAEYLAKYNVNVWLVNTGWVGGKYGVGKRMDLPTTRKLIDAIHDGSLKNAKYKKFPVFDIDVPESVPGVDPKILWPQNGWAN
jgi:phosphoenolpyruvate carboxykinase (ATP)